MPHWGQFIGGFSFPPQFLVYHRQPWRRKEVVSFSAGGVALARDWVTIRRKVLTMACHGFEKP
jgi:hypothetical protein